MIATRMLTAVSDKLVCRLLVFGLASLEPPVDDLAMRTGMGGGGPVTVMMVTPEDEGSLVSCWGVTWRYGTRLLRAYQSSTSVMRPGKRRDLSFGMQPD